MWKVEQGKLPPRQADVLEGIAQGKTDKEMAKEFGISPETIKSAVSTLYYKLRIVNAKRSALVAEAIAKGVLVTGTTMILISSMLVNMAAQEDMEMRRSSTRLTTRITRVSRSGRRDGVLSLELDEIEDLELAA